MEGSNGFDADSGGGAGDKYGLVGELVEEVFIEDDLRCCGSVITFSLGVFVDGGVWLNSWRHGWRVNELLCLSEGWKVVSCRI